MSLRLAQSFNRISAIAPGGVPAKTQSHEIIFSAAEDSLKPRVTRSANSYLIPSSGVSSLPLILVGRFASSENEPKSRPPFGL